jgi:hypothetical protein
MRQAVRPLFNSHPKFVVCGEAEHGREAIEKAPSLQSDLIVIDMSMPVMNVWKRPHSSSRSCLMCGSYCSRLMSSPSCTR